MTAAGSGSDWGEVGLVAAGGAVGTLARMLLEEPFEHAFAVLGLGTTLTAGHMPVGLLTVNVTGAFLLGLLVAYLPSSGVSAGRAQQLRLLFGTGLLGGYTTYSALAVGTAGLLLAGELLAGAGYALATLVIGGVASWLGILCGAMLVRARATKNAGEHT